MSTVSLERQLRQELPRLASSANPFELTQYSRDLWPRRLLELSASAQPPRAGLVVWPASALEVAEVVHWALKRGVSVVPFGAGSGVCGAIAPGENSIVVDLKRMSGMSISGDGPFLDVGPGAMGLPLEDELNRKGYTLGHFPSSILCSTVGGWVAARGAGQCSGRYGKVEDMVAQVTLVTGRAEVVQARYRRSGPNLLPLLVGSEGTLGIFTSLRLRLYPKPTAREFLAFEFADIERGMSALRELFQRGLRPAVTRLYDPLDSFLFARSGGHPKSAQASSELGARLKGTLLREGLRFTSLGMRAIERLERLKLVRCLLIVVFEGEAELVRSQAARALDCCRSEGGESLGTQPALRWYEHRYDVSFKQSKVFRAGAFSDTFEVAATWSNLSAVYTRVRRAVGQHALVLAHLSHAYPDGCSIYFTFVAEAPPGERALSKYDQIWRVALEAAVESGATISHHHGVGRSKREFLLREWGTAGASLQKALRRALDPAEVFNPGNLEPNEAALSQAGTARTFERGRSAPFAGLLEPGHAPKFDEQSQLVQAGAGHTLGSVEASASRSGLSLPFAEGWAERSVQAWVEAGMPGGHDPWSDPVSQGLAGLHAEVAGGAVLEVRPMPRRATGPDLRALFVGTRGQVGKLLQACLVLERKGVDQHARFTTELDRDPHVSPEEEVLFGRIVKESGLEKA